MRIPAKQTDNNVRNTPIAIYFTILFVLSTGVIGGAMMLREQGTYLAQGYMLTPASGAESFCDVFCLTKRSFCGLRREPLS